MEFCHPLPQCVPCVVLLPAIIALSMRCATPQPSRFSSQYRPLFLLKGTDGCIASGVSAELQPVTMREVPGLHICRMIVSEECGGTCRLTRILTGPRSMPALQETVSYSIARSRNGLARSRQETYLKTTYTCIAINPPVIRCIMNNLLQRADSKLQVCVCVCVCVLSVNIANVTNIIYRRFKSSWTVALVVGEIRAHVFSPMAYALA